MESEAVSVTTICPPHVYFSTFNPPPFSNLKMLVKNRTIIISGGCSGLGLATAKDLHSLGAYIALLDLNAEAGAEITAELGQRSKFWEVDVADTESVEAAVKGAAEWAKSTGAEVGGVVAAAGVGAAQKVRWI
jgi:3-hydroxyacyl-CoA dehydrogenase / 3-hydroxy-2-methylbutyryl-CoA dehydrogenase